jgi:steroid delta-isomerase-like uncharacterized protein
MSEENKAVSRAVAEMISDHDLSRLDEVYAPEVVNHDPTTGEVQGRDEMREYLSGYLEAFSDLRMTVLDQVAEGDKVVSRWRAEGTHDGELLGIPPSGNRISVEGVTTDRFEGGQIVEAWDLADFLGLMQQVGAVPAEATA